MIKRMYDKTIIGLNERHPESFPLSEFSFDLFKFAWNSIQARAFGRRLPWTAMVPFADCLNHSNVQTKYDYNVDDNGLFRLFPSGANCYCAGKEVFNSYGRRPNDNLLLDYGFAILDNEWDEVELSLGMPDDEPNKALKSRILLAEGISSHRRYRLRPGEVPLEALTFLRIVSLSAESIMAVDAAEQRARATLREDFVEAGDLYHCSDKEDGLPPIRHSSGYDLPLSAQSERRCLQLLRDILGSMVRSRETSVQQDQQLLADLKALRGATEELLTLPSERDKASVSVRYDSEQYWKLVNCLHYRITRKLIVDSVIESTDALLTAISAGSLSSGHVDQMCTSLTDMQRYVSGNKRYKSKFEQYFKSICDEKTWVLR